MEGLDIPKYFVGDYMYRCVVYCKYRCVYCVYRCVYYMYRCGLQALIYQLLIDCTLAA